jgi:hypothetical protein
MRLGIVFALATVMGLSVGVVTGRAVSGGTQPDIARLENSAQINHLLESVGGLSAIEQSPGEVSGVSGPAVSGSTASSLLVQESSGREAPDHLGVKAHATGAIARDVDGASLPSF